MWIREKRDQQKKPPCRGHSGRLSERPLGCLQNLRPNPDLLALQGVVGETGDFKSFKAQECTGIPGKGAPTWNQYPLREKSPETWSFLSLAFGNVPSLCTEIAQNKFAYTRPTKPVWSHEWSFPRHLQGTQRNSACDIFRASKGVPGVPQGNLRKSLGHDREHFQGTLMAMKGILPWFLLLSSQTQRLHLYWGGILMRIKTTCSPWAAPFFSGANDFQALPPSREVCPSWEHLLLFPKTQLDRLSKPWKVWFLYDSGVSIFLEVTSERPVKYRKNGYFRECSRACQV